MRAEVKAGKPQSVQMAQPSTGHASTSDATETIAGYEAERWCMAEALRGSMDTVEDKYAVRGPIFLPSISDGVEEHRRRLQQGSYADAEDPNDWRAQNLFWMPHNARWERLWQNPRQRTIGRIVDDAMEGLGRGDPALNSVILKDYARPTLDKTRSGQLLDDINNITNITVDDASGRRDVFGRAHEDFWSQFASEGGKRGGES